LRLSGLFGVFGLKGSLGIPKEASFWRADKLALHQSTAQPKSGGRAAEKLEVIPKLWRGRLPWDTQEPINPVYLVYLVESLNAFTH